MGELTIEHFLVVSALLFVIGMLGVLTRKNILIIFMSIELMLNAVNISLVAFGGLLIRWSGRFSRSSSLRSRLPKPRSVWGSSWSSAAARIQWT